MPRSDAMFRLGTQGGVWGVRWHGAQAARGEIVADSNGVIAEDVFELAEQVAMVVHPGDVVLFKVPDLTAAKMAAVRTMLDHFEEKTGLVFMVVADDISVSVLRKE